jgi:hypothetical protein
VHDLTHNVLIPQLQFVDPSSSPTTSSPAPTVPTSPVRDNTVKVAVVTALGLVMATGITAIATTFRRVPSARSTLVANDNFTKQYIAGLERDRKELIRVRRDLNLLRESVIDRGMNPDHLIHEQRTIQSRES